MFMLLPALGTVAAYGAGTLVETRHAAASAKQNQGWSDEDDMTTSDVRRQDVKDTKK